MKDEITTLAEILDRAIAFEEEGMSFFNEKAQTAGSPLQANVLRSLAKDEQNHKQYLLEIKEELRRSSRLDSLPEDGRRYRGPREIFEESLRKAADPYDSTPEELSALDGALEVERRGYTMYAKAAERVESARARDLLLHLAAQEQNHFELVRNTRDYMADPSGWHGYHESPMLDGG